MNKSQYGNRNTKNVVVLAICQALFNSGRTLAFIAAALVAISMLGDDLKFVTAPITMMLVGTAGGLAAAGGVAILLQPVLYDLTPWDPLVYGSAAVALGLVAAVGSWIPARRATSIDPVIALRCE